MRFWIDRHGCAKNDVDGEEISARLEAAGHSCAEGGADALYAGPLAAGCPRATPPPAARNAQPANHSTNAPATDRPGLAPFRLAVVRVMCVIGSHFAIRGPQAAVPKPGHCAQRGP